MSDEGAVDSVEELLVARREIATLKARLSGVSVADDMVCQAEQEAAYAQSELADADAVRKEAKKRFEAAIEHLRKLVRDRASGQMALPFDDALAPVAAVKASPAAGVEPVAVAGEVSPDDAGPDDELTTGKPEEIPAGVRRIDARLGSISIPGEQDEMVAVPPGVVAILAAEGLHTCRDIWPALRAGKLKIKGLGPAKLKQLADVVTAWVGDDGAALVVEESQVAGEPTHLYCEECREWFGLDVEECKTCGEPDLHRVGCYGDQAVDSEGDIVAGCETIEIEPGEYPASSVIVVDKRGGWRSGWMVAEDSGGEAWKIGAYPSILRPSYDTRPKAIAAAVADMRAYLAANGSSDVLGEWDRAVIERVGGACVPKTVLPF
ncbi:hypothetical protein UFOVP466_31 [uncultured Caudovirales phage]|uniref:Uncharacterized protein n=1 Tax=uncultured Caudovirales phage TaxID=2100421 RepID=A0A6J5MB77_9CAUD|nr:hypothetical protein UFOVP466_31 [uncultured Caudovirales phage]CAB4180681.1 hypothetical protein UFOVP1045_78 [uncultured Caudovirales phage]CAB4190087.1 hypothetical protein UFOVP1194_32 [uncultured Caudovirales phage]CAB4221791.1 hypothetical protein UFOVP1641_28 [uncultured Caudovirales phage]